MRAHPFAIVGILALLSILLQCVSSEESVEEKLINIETRLKEHIELDRPRCDKSPWQTQYTELHKSILSSSDPKVLVAIPHLSGKRALTTPQRLFLNCCLFYHQEWRTE